MYTGALAGPYVERKSVSMGAMVDPAYGTDHQVYGQHKGVPGLGGMCVRGAHPVTLSPSTPSLLVSTTSGGGQLAELAHIHLLDKWRQPEPGVDVVCAFVVRWRGWYVCLPSCAAPPTSRVLHTGREYTVGRKEGAVDLCIPMLRVSRMAGTLQVASMTAEQLSDPSYIPQVCWIMHARSKTGSLVETYRGKNRVEQRIRVETPIPLTDRARVRLVNDVSLELHWVPCTVGIVRVPSLEAEDVRRRACASGVHLVVVRESLDVRCTHLCVAHVRPNRTQLLALVRGIPIVTAAYVEAAIACPAESAWPDSRLYVPPLDARIALDTPLSTSQLAPSPKRATLFRGTTLVFVLPGLERRYVGP